LINSTNSNKNQTYKKRSNLSPERATEIVLCKLCKTVDYFCGVHANNSVIISGRPFRARLLLFVTRPVGAGLIGQPFQGVRKTLVHVILIVAKHNIYTQFGASEQLSFARCLRGDYDQGGQ
jgi:TPP-dependent indolepyruvate ferredoxin oxidoreductase alpha subunit